MKLLFSNIIIITLLSGCVAKYVEPLATQPTAQITFERSAKSPILGSSTFFVSLDDSFVCKPGQGFVGQEKMATIDKGNPLVKNDNNGAIRILAKDNFRLLVRNVAGFSTCDVVLGFKSEQGKNYKLKLITDLKSREISCSVEMSEIDEEEKENIIFTEYEVCKTT